MIKFALAGNPNCGKTTLFNALTGSTAHVGNWPGVTVDKKEGTYKKCAEPISIIDLPGIYSLSPYTPEEVISRNYILDERPDCVINIVDATNLERNLYLTTQIMEIDVPMVIALNMMDEVEKSGDTIDAKTLEKKIGVPVVSISALRSEGIDELMTKAYAECKKERKGVTVLNDTSLAHLIGDVKIALEGKDVFAPLFHAVKLVELDELEVEAHKDCVKMVQGFKETFDDDVFGTDFEAIVADGRYKYISENFSPVVKKAKKKKGELTKSDKIDKVLTNKWASIPIFLVILFAVFHLTFSENLLYLGSIIPAFGEWCGAEASTSAGATLKGIFFAGGINSPGVILFNLLDFVTASIGDAIVGGLESAGAADWVIGFIGDGVLGGLFGVLSFLPQILVLFLFFSILEDSGYMARVAFILDRIFRRFGVSGRAFMPMIMGFGCSIPAMVNTRTLADEKERVATVRVIPFFSCGAKLPILTAIAGGIVMAFGVGNADVITYSMYVIGMAVAVVALIVMRSTTMRGETPPFIMELPTYHAPQFKNLMLHLWDKTKHFVKKAFTIILVSTIVIWFLSAFGWDWRMVENMNDSILASLGKFIQPIFTPLGFGSQLGAWGWVFAVAAVTGLIAKENVVATFFSLACAIVTVAGSGALTGLSPEVLAELSALIAGGEGSEEGALEAVAMIAATGANIPALISFIVFNMTTIPCFAAVATAKAEMSKPMFNGTLIFWLATSYIVSMIVYTVGLAITDFAKYGWFILLWVVVCAIVILIIHNLKKREKKA